MSKTVTNVIKGIGAGMAAGITVGVVGSAMLKNGPSGRKIKKNGKRAVQAMEDILENVQYMFK